MTEKLVWIEAITQRPAIRCRTSRSASRSDSPSKRSASSSPRPIVFPSRMPLTESDSWTMLEMSASDSCVVFAIRRRSLPTRRVSTREDRDQREREERELPAQKQHADHRRDDRRQARRDARGGVRDDVLHAADVVVDPRLHLARAGAREEGEREALQVAEDRGAQVVHDALTDLVREQRLDHAEDSGDDRDHDHRGGVHGDRVRVVRLDRDQDAPEQERRHHAEAGAEDDQPEQPREPPPVRPEEPPDPPHVRAPHLGVGRPLGRRLSPVVEEHPHQGPTTTAD